MLTLTQDQIDVCNKALLQVGSKTITSTDENVEARISQANYQMALEEVLSVHTWSCAMRQAVLISTEKDALGRFIYPVPDGFIRLVEVNQNSVCGIEYELLGKNVYLDYSNRISLWSPKVYYAKNVLVMYEDWIYQCTKSHTSVEGITPDDSDNWTETDGLGFIHIKYVSDIQPADFSGLFLSCFVPLLAANMATALSSSDSKRINLYNEYKVKLQEARRIDLMQRNSLQGIGKFNLSRY
jgi:hypothetical protein